MLLRFLRPLVGIDHVAFIMDGNRRYARRLGLHIANGHRKGLEKLLEVCLHDEGWRPPFRLLPFAVP